VFGPRHFSNYRSQDAYLLWNPWPLHADFPIEAAIAMPLPQGSQQAGRAVDDAQGKQRAEKPLSACAHSRLKMITTGN
jgi:hypothetical protein